MTQTFKVLSALLTYPTPELQAAAPEMPAVLERERLLPEKQIASVGRLIGEVETRDIYDLQERYVLLFDRTRSLSLHLFEHVYGESRDRGAAMVDLAQAYEQRGLMIAANELPDFLPLFLEFLSVLPPEEARDWLGQTVHIIAAFRQRLRKRGSPYAAVFWAIETLANAKPDAEAFKGLGAQEDDDPNDLEALDRAWEDAPVTFGPGDAAGDGCSRDRLVSQIRAGHRPAPPINDLPQG